VKFQVVIDTVGSPMICNLEADAPEDALIDALSHAQISIKDQDGLRSYSVSKILHELRTAK